MGQKQLVLVSQLGKGHACMFLVVYIIVQLSRINYRYLLTMLILDFMKTGFS